jgi:deoxyribonuclease V
LRLAQLIHEQNELAGRVRVIPYPGSIETVAGADVAIKKGYLYSCIGVFSFPQLRFICDSYARLRIAMPYIPGFLSYRELPVLVKAYKRIRQKPDIILIDGQGIAHPRGLGLASHLGVILGVPTIGCAKSHLYGAYTMPASARGAHTVMKSGGRRIGVVLRTRVDVKPLFVSPGHLVDIRDCLRIVLGVTNRYRIPEPIRYAHKGAGLSTRKNCC